MNIGNQRLAPNGPCGARELAFLTLLVYCYLNRRGASLLGRMRSIHMAF
jgi:hypothetical protein